MRYVGLQTLLMFSELTIPDIYAVIALNYGKNRNCF
jgi:hypothetical protein